MNIDDIKLMYEYNYWANRHLLNMAEQITPEQWVIPTDFSFGSLRATLVHTLDGEYGWRLVLTERIITFDLDPTLFPDVASLRMRWESDELAMWGYLNSLTNDDLLGFATWEIEGRTRRRVLWHCLYHLVNHGTQHRSESATMLTTFGKSPGDIDFTVFLNQRQ